MAAFDEESGCAPPVFDVDADELAKVVLDRDGAWVSESGGPAAVTRSLRSDPRYGLSGDEIRGGSGMDARLAAFGTNNFRYPPPKGFFRLMLEAFNDNTIIVLCIAAVVSLVIGLALEEKRDHYGYLEGIAIVVVVLVVVLVQATIDFQKEIKFRQLNSVRDSYQVQAIRGGEMMSIAATDIVVGDVLKIAAGDKVPADGLLLDGSNLRTNESAMTGEVVDVAKHPDDDCFMLSGTTVSEGVGHMVVIAVGERSQWGTILAGLIVEPEDTPLQIRLNRLAMSIGRLGIFFAAATFTVSMIRWGVDSARQGGVEDATDVLDFFIDAITIIVVAIPEGLPLAITLGLAFAMRKMMKDRNLVRRLEACETMGSATQLNADKTGTLTQNRMTVVEADWAGSHFVYDASHASAHAQGEVPMSGRHDSGDEDYSSGDAADLSDSQVLADAFRDLVARSIASNSQASLQRTPEGVVEHLGSKTECALLQLVEKWGMSYTKLRAELPPSRVYLFNSAKKRMSSTVDLPGAGDMSTRLFTKGAPEIVANLCESQLEADGVTTTPMDHAARAALLDKVNSMASRGLRTLMLAYRDVTHDKKDEVFWEEAPESGLICLGVVGIKDPIRPETKEAVRLLKGAGVTVRMVTGDNPLTARFIAKEAGILDDDGVVMQGPEFRKMTPEHMDAVAKKIQVLARSTPKDKLTLVREHKKLGEVVAVTGDGTNDAPALKEADVGFALGLAGTEIAKEACDIVILDDNIESMAKAVLWGRNVYESIRKFLQFQLVVNVVAVSLNFISACAGQELPLTPVPLLWVNMIMDSMGALALATEPPRRELMERKPFGRRAPLINRAMYRNIIGVSVYQLAVCLVLQMAGDRLFSIDCYKHENLSGACSGQTLEVNTIIFNAFVFMQIGSEINSRRIPERNVFAGIFQSYMFLVIIGITVVIQVVLMLGVGGTQVGVSIGIGKISWQGWVASLILGAIVLPWGYLVRLWPLDWSFGPTDENPLEMSKLERLLHFPARKPAAFDKGGGDEEDGVVDGMVPTVAKDMDEADEGDGEADVEVDVVGDGGEAGRAGSRTSSSRSAGGESADGRAAGAGAGAGAGAAPVQRLASVELARAYGPRPDAPLPSRVRLRVFVHAVAFVNVVSRRVSSAVRGENPLRAARSGT